MGAVANIVAAVQANDLLGAAVFPGITSAVGLLDVKLNHSPPRVVWVPEGGSVEATDHVGGRLVGGPVGTRERDVRTRVQRFAVHCWGEDFAQAEALLDAVVAACWQEARGRVQFGDFAFFGQQAGTADYALLGEKVVLSVTFRVPVRDSVAAQSEVSDQSHVGNFVSDLDESVVETVC